MTPLAASGVWPPDCPVYLDRVLHHSGASPPSLWGNGPGRALECWPSRGLGLMLQWNLWAGPGSQHQWVLFSASIALALAAWWRPPGQRWAAATVAGVAELPADTDAGEAEAANAAPIALSGLFPRWLSALG